MRLQLIDSLNTNTSLDKMVQAQIHADNGDWLALIMCSTCSTAQYKSNWRITHLITSLFKNMPLPFFAQLWANSIEEAEKPTQFSLRDGCLLKRIPNGLKRNQLKNLLQIILLEDNDLASCLSAMMIGQSEYSILQWSAVH